MLGDVVGHRPSHLILNRLIVHRSHRLGSFPFHGQIPHVSGLAVLDDYFALGQNDSVSQTSELSSNSDRLVDVWFALSANLVVITLPQDLQ